MHIDDVNVKKELVNRLSFQILSTLGLEGKVQGIKFLMESSILAQD